VAGTSWLFEKEPINTSDPRLAASPSADAGVERVAVPNEEGGGDKRHQPALTIGHPLLPFLVQLHNWDLGRKPDWISGDIMPKGGLAIRHTGAGRSTGPLDDLGNMSGRLGRKILVFDPQVWVMLVSYRLEEKVAPSPDKG
jgi:hypothetical protein